MQASRIATIVLILTAPAMSDAESEWQKLESAFDEAQNTWFAEIEKLEGDDGVIMMSAEGMAGLPPHPADTFKPRVRKFAETHHGKPTALRAIMWLIMNDMGFPGMQTDNSSSWALQQLSDHHVKDPRLEEFVGGLMYATMSVDENDLITLLERVGKDNPSAAARGHALLTAAQILYEDPPLPPMMLNRQDRKAKKQRAGEILRTLKVDYKGSAIGAQAEAYLYAIENLQVGKVAPDIIGRDVDGKEIKLSQFRGQVVAVVFWGTWCKPCMAMVPHERELVEKFKGRPFTILGINTDESPDILRKTLKEERMTWPTIFDGMPGSICGTWHIQAFPTSYILDPEGIIRHKNLPVEMMGSAIEPLLAAPKP